MNELPVEVLQAVLQQLEFTFRLPRLIFGHHDAVWVSNRVVAPPLPSPKPCVARRRTVAPAVCKLWRDICGDLAMWPTLELDFGQAMHSTTVCSWVQKHSPAVQHAVVGCTSGPWKVE